MTQLQTRLSKLEAKTPKAKRYDNPITVYQKEGEDVYRLDIDAAETMTEAEFTGRIQRLNVRPGTVSALVIVYPGE